MKAKEVIKLIQKDGWMFERQTGSHKIFKHPTKKGIVVVPEHGKEDIKWVHSIQFLNRLV